MQGLFEPTASAPAEAPGVWLRVIPFIVLAFGLTWLLDLAIWLRGGLAQPFTALALQLQMLIPASSVILLGLFSPRFGSGRVRESTGQARRFFYFFLLLAAAYVVCAAAAMVLPDPLPALVVGQALTFVGIIGLLVLRLAKGRETFTRAGLTFGKPIHWLAYGAAIVAFYSLMAALNRLFGLGSVPDRSALLQSTGMPPEVFLVLAAVQTVVVGPFLGLVITFGEEYGWRGFLQGELVKLGRVRGVLAVGVIWGLWHAPVIAMGYNFPGYPVIGIFVMVAFCVVAGFVLGYAVLKTGSVWLSAFAHAITNQVVAFLLAIVYLPRDPVLQFDGGIYGILIGALIVVLILRDPVWKAKDQLSS